MWTNTFLNCWNKIFFSNKVHPHGDIDLSKMILPNLWSQALRMFNYDQFFIKCYLHIWRNVGLDSVIDMLWVTLNFPKWPWKTLLHIWRNVDIGLCYRYALSDFELSKMTLRDLDQEVLVSRNVCHLQHKFLRRYELERKDRRTGGRADTTATVCFPENFLGA
jgi:hypothetical protein